MPVERRIIHFSSAELQAAVVNYCTRQGIRIPRDGIRRVRQKEDEAHVFVIEYRSDDEEAAKSTTMEEAQIGAALIGYCHVNHMPVPHFAEKKLEPDGEGGVRLVIDYRWDDAWRDPPPDGP